MTDRNELKRNFECFKNFLLERASAFGVSEWIAVKSALISMGILIGAGFSGFFKKLRPLLSVIMVLGSTFALLRIFAPVFDDFKRD